MPVPVNVNIVLAPLVVTVGLPVVVPVYLAVGIDSITTPEPPLKPETVLAPPEPPPPLLATPLAALPPPSDAVP